MAADFVTLDQGTGVVHIAPGHGADDYALGVANGLEVTDHLDGDGVYRAHVPLFAGERVLTPDGKVSEAPIACFFMVRGGRLITPSADNNILESITRDTILTRYRELTGEHAEVRTIDRSELYFAEEAFVCGTGQEILPVTAIDRLPVGAGKVGSLTDRMRRDYFDLVRGAIPDRPEWRTLI